MNYVFSDGEGTSDNNSGADYATPISCNMTAEHWTEEAPLRTVSRPAMSAAVLVADRSFANLRLHQRKRRRDQHSDRSRQLCAQQLVPTPLHHMQLTAEKALKEAERRAAEEAEAARRAEDDRVDMEWAAARVSEAQERQTSSADGALSRCETEFGVAWACDPPVRGQELLSATWHFQQFVFLGR